MINGALMNTQQMESLPGYTAALTGAAFYRIPEAGYLVAAGLDQLTFLQRQTSNDLRLVSPGKFVVTALTNPNARILDVLTVFQDPAPGTATAEAVPLASSPCRGTPAKRRAS